MNWHWTGSKHLMDRSTRNLFWCAIMMNREPLKWWLFYYIPPFQTKVALRNWFLNLHNKLSVNIIFKGSGFKTVAYWRKFQVQVSISVAVCLMVHIKCASVAVCHVLRSCNISLAIAFLALLCLIKKRVQSLKGCLFSHVHTPCWRPRVRCRCE